MTILLSDELKDGYLADFSSPMKVECELLLRPGTSLQAAELNVLDIWVINSLRWDGLEDGGARGGGGGRTCEKGDVTLGCSQLRPQQR